MSTLQLSYRVISLFRIAYSKICKVGETLHRLSWHFVAIAPENVNYCDDIYYEFVCMKAEWDKCACIDILCQVYLTSHSAD